VWITGLPSSGKSTIAAELVKRLQSRDIKVAVLESDALREVFTPHPNYRDEERDAFYRAVAGAGMLIVQHGIPVVFDATANRRRYRDWARNRIPRFLEVYVRCPLHECMARDAKGIYRQALSGGSNTVPGLGSDYEPPAAPELVVDGERERPEDAARRIVDKLDELHFLQEVANETLKVAPHATQ
jgi:adenylylsulfate kinase